MTDANSSWAPPEEFDEYRIVRPLGTGSMGQVYLAHDLVLERTVAVKFVSPAVWNQKIRRRFLTEARAAARVQHPNVIAIYRIGEINRRPYIITEFASGTSLEKIPRPLPHEQVLRLALGLARGLAAAHRRGVLHRDIKLANAVLNEDGVVKILDFGLAKLDKLELEPDASSSGWSSTLGPNESTKKLLDPNAAKGSRTAAKNATKNAAKKARTASGAAASEGDAGEDGERDGNVDRLAATLPVEERELAEGDTEDDDEDARPAVSGRWRGIEVDSTVKPVVEKVRDSQSSDDDLLVGTPRYMAPELWRLEPATTRSDVYALGVMLYILCCDHTPYPEESPAALAALVQNEEPTPLQRHAPDVDPRLADVIGRCLKRDPADRYDSAESLRIALEALLDPAPEVLDTESNPYCGLLAFDADRRSVFFGRSEEIRAAVERLRDDPFVLVAGDSGVGKSSLCRAGVVPRVAEGALDPNLKWVCVSMVPGRRPLSTLLTVLTSELEFAGPPPESSLRSDDELLQAFSKSARDPSETTLAGAVRDELDGVLRAVRRRSGPEEGRLLFIDQLEELVTMSDPEEAATTGLLLARIAEGIPRMRLLATVRGDFITRVTQIEGFGAVIGRGLMLLQPLSPEGARAAVVGPAQSRGVRFESDALVNELVETGAGNSLPLLQFALAELWNVRDQARGVITARALETIGGVSGALARHAESVLTSLLPEQRLAARKLLLRLVTVDDTRATLPERDLTEGDADAQAALEALVKGRLVAARDSVEGVVYDITHEALISRWYTLRFWLDEKREARAVAGRVEVAAREWTRLGRPRDALWGGKQLSEASTLEREDLRKHEVEFLEASELLIRRKRRRRRAALSAVPVLLALIYGGVRLQMQRDLQRRVQARLSEAAVLVEEARALEDKVEVDAGEALAAFDSMKVAEGEALWAKVGEGRRAIDGLLKQAGQKLENAIILDPGSAEASARLAAVLYEQAELAEREGKDELARELVNRVELYDREREFTSRWRAPARLEIRTSPAGLAVTIARFSDDAARTLGPARELGVTPLSDVSLETGSYLLSVRGEGRAAFTLPFAAARGASQVIELAAPAASAIPEDFVYVPAGRFLFGASGDTDLRSFLNAVPQHEVTTDAYLIARHETTYADWIRYLDAMPPDERAARAPRMEGAGASVDVALEQLETGEWRYSLTSGGARQQALVGERISYPTRGGSKLDWTKLPVSGVDFSAALAYAEWLSRSGAVPGARLCTEHEWERAARGADDRRFPHGDGLAPGDANFDETYGKEIEALAPDEIGSYPQSRSPFGLYDMAGNVWEWTRSSVEPEGTVIRGGGFFRDRLSARASNRAVFDPGFKSISVGVRICASRSHER